MGHHSTSIFPHVIGKTIYYTAIYCYILLIFMQCNLAATHPHGSKGPARCSHQMYRWLSGTWETASLRKILVNSLILSLTLENSPDLSSSVYIVFHSIILIFEQFSLIMCHLYFLFSVSLHILRFLTLFDTCAYRLDYCRSHYRIMFSVLKYLDKSCCWM